MARETLAVVRSRLEAALDLCDKQQASIILLREDNARLKAKLAAVPTDVSHLDRAERKPILTGIRARAKEIGLHFRCASRVKNGVVQLYSKQRGEWRDVPDDYVLPII